MCELLAQRHRPCAGRWSGTARTGLWGNYRDNARVLAAITGNLGVRADAAAPEDCSLQIPTAVTVPTVQKGAP
jgi:hypothetical protein